MTESVKSWSLLLKIVLEGLEGLIKEAFRIRVLFAVALLFVAFQHAGMGRTLLEKDIEKLVSTTKVVTETAPPASAKKENAQAAKEADNKVEQNQIRREETTTTRVWAYGMQLAIWAGILGILLWAIVALCRDD